MFTDFSAIILSGGLNTRMQGLNKIFLELHGDTFLQRLLNILQPLFSEVLLVTRKPELYQDMHVSIVQDIYQIRSALTGIHAGLFHAQCAQAFVTACDTPLLQPALIKILVQNWNSLCQVVVPKNGELFEPLCALYSRQCLPWIEDLLHREQVKISNLFSLVQTRPIPVELLRNADPDLLSFFNVNKPQDLCRAEKLLKKQ